MNHFEIKAWDNGGQMAFREIRKPTTIKRKEKFTIKQQEFPIFIFNWYDTCCNWLPVNALVLK